MLENPDSPVDLTPSDAAALGASGLIARIEATADDKAAARRAYFTELGRRGGLARQANARAAKAVS